MRRRRRRTRHVDAAGPLVEESCTPNRTAAWCTARPSSIPAGRGRASSSSAIRRRQDDALLCGCWAQATRSRATSNLSLAGRAIARPRTLRVKAAACPCSAARPGDRRLACVGVLGRDAALCGRPGDRRPAVANRRGRSRERGVPEPNHGGLSRITPIDALEGLRRLLGECTLPRTAVGQTVVRLRALLAKARLCALLLGDLDRALSLIRNAVS